MTKLKVPSEENGVSPISTEIAKPIHVSIFISLNECPQNHSSQILIVSGLAEKPFEPESKLLNPALRCCGGFPKAKSIL